MNRGRTDEELSSTAFFSHLFDSDSGEHDVEVNDQAEGEEDE